MEKKSTLNVTKDIAKDLIPSIDGSNFFFLGKETTDRLDLFNFALALGLKEGKATPLKTITSLVRTERLDKDNVLLMSIYRAIYYSKKIATNEEPIDKIEDDDAVLSLIEQYANTGFSIIGEYMNDFDNESIMYKLLADIAEFQE